MGFFFERQGEVKKILSLTPTHTRNHNSKDHAKLKTLSIFNCQSHILHLTLNASVLPVSCLTEGQNERHRNDFYFSNPEWEDQFLL